MGYSKHTWTKGEGVTATKMNNIETGVETIDTGKMDKVNPTGSGKLTMGNSYTDASSQIGYSVSSTGDSSHAEGYYTSSSSYGSHAEGMGARATNWGAHAEGARAFLAGSQYILASGKGAHAEGFADAAVGSSTNHIIASGDGSHAEGSNTEATAYAAHAEGVKTKSSGQGSHSEGVGTEAKADGQHVEGKYNNTSTTALHIVGNGITETNKSNAYLLESDGTGRYKGDVYVECNADSTGGSRLAKVSEIKTNFNQLEGTVTNSQLAGEISNDKLVNKSIIIAGSSVSLGESISAETLKSNLGITNVMHYIGKTTTTITDGSTTNPITINGSSVTAVSGDVVIDNSNDQEYVWNGAWQKLGGSSSYKVKQTAVPSPSASGTATAFIDTISQDTNGNITVTKKNIIDNDTKNTAGSTNTTDTIYLIGAKTQAANPQTYSNSAVYETNGTVNMTNLKVSKCIGVADCTAEDAGSVAEGELTEAHGGSHAEGCQTIAGNISHAEGGYGHTYYTTESVTTLPGIGQGSDYGVLYIPTTSGTIDNFPFIANHKYMVRDKNTGHVRYEEIGNSDIDWANHIEGYCTLATGCSHVEGEYAFADDCSHAEGYSTTANGESSHAEGRFSTASAKSSHAEGISTEASGWYSHAEGSGTEAQGSCSHAEGENTKAGYASHAEGYKTYACYEITTVETLSSPSDADYGIVYKPTTSGTIDDFEFIANNYYAIRKYTTKEWVWLGSSQPEIKYQHAEGNNTIAAGGSAHAEGYETFAADCAHAEGSRTLALGDVSHAEGITTFAEGQSSHAEGDLTKAIGVASHAEGTFTVAEGNYSHAEGHNTNTKGAYAHSEGYNTSASGGSSHAEGNGTRTTMDNAHAEGEDTRASGQASHSEGCETKAEGDNSHAEGYNTKASGAQAHAEGATTYATADNAHAEGSNTHASARDAHAEGDETYATANWSHAEGRYSRASGQMAHAEGCQSEAEGESSHAEGQYTIANGIAQHVQGRCNIADTSENFADIVGNGDPDAGTNSNAFALTWTGEGRYASNVYVNCNSDSTGGTKVIAGAASATNLGGVRLSFSNGTLTIYTTE